MSAVRWNTPLTAPHREATIEVGEPIFTSKKQIYPVPKVTVAKMRKWIGHHPPGSLQTIHYDPSDPPHISLAGADEELQTASAGDRLLLGVIACVVGLVLIAVKRRSV